MTAVRTVRYYVSDCHAERHPYDAAKGFAGAAQRDAHVVHDGALPNSLGYLLQRITCTHYAQNSSSNDDGDDGTRHGDEDEQRARALHYLHAHTSSPELAVRLLCDGVVGRVVCLLAYYTQSHDESVTTTTTTAAAARGAPRADVDMRRLVVQQALLLLRSLCRVPQGVLYVARGGGVGAALHVLAHATRTTSAVARPTHVDVATAAVQLLHAVASERVGRTWLLRTPSARHSDDDDKSEHSDDDDAQDEACARDLAALQLRGADAPVVVVGVPADHHDDDRASAAASALVTRWRASCANDVVACLVTVLDACTQQQQHDAAVATTQQQQHALSLLEVHVLSTLSALTAELRGVRACVRCVDVLDHLARRLRSVRERVAAAAVAAATRDGSSRDSDAAHEETHMVQLFTTLWNIALDTRAPAATTTTTRDDDDEGSSISSADMLDARGVTDELFALLHHILVHDSDDASVVHADAAATLPARPGRRHPHGRGIFAYAVQRHMLGALAALHALTRVKLRSTDALGRYASRTHALLALLQRVNACLDAKDEKATGALLQQQQQQQQQHAALVAMSTNIVHCLRLSSEVAAVRAYTHAWLEDVAARCPVDAFYLRRQLYYRTAWQAEYNAHV